MSSTVSPPPYSRDKVRVLLSIDPIATDMMQGRCFGQCLRDDNDYPVAWIRQHGKARVFYTSLGHNPDVFWDTADADDVPGRHPVRARRSGR